MTKHANLLKNLVIRDLKHRYVGSIGGFMWSIAQPVSQLLIYWFAFTVVFQTQLDVDAPGVNVPVFLLAGLLPWFLFTDTIMRNCSVLTDNAALITKTTIPAEILPLAITLSNLVTHGAGLIVILAALAGLRHVPLSAIGIFLYLPILLLFAQGIAWIVSGLQVFVRDTIQVLQIVIAAWFWLTPVMYGANRLKDFAQIAMLSPVAVSVTGYRQSLLGLSQPPALQVALAAAISLAVFFVGALFFRRAKPAFADVL